MAVEGAASALESPCVGAKTAGRFDLRRRGMLDESGLRDQLEIGSIIG